MDTYTLKWPTDFDDYSWELESKGWFSGVEVLINGRTLLPIFYDPVRLSQDIDAELSGSGFFVEPCLIVVGRVCRESMEAAIAELAKSGRLGRLAAK